jgi:hypothetical protein
MAESVEIFIYIEYNSKSVLSCVWISCEAFIDVEAEVLYYDHSE